MQVRIRPSRLSELALSYRTISTASYSSSGPSTSTASSTSSSSRKHVPRPRRESADVWRDQTIAPDTLLTSVTGGSPTTGSKPSRMNQSRQPLSTHMEQPVLKANPYANTYRIDDSELDEWEGDSNTRLDCATSLSDGFDRLDDELLDESVPHRPATDESAPDLDKALGGEPRRVVSFKSGESVKIKKGCIQYDPGQGNPHRELKYQRESWNISYHRLRDACPCPKCIDPSTRQRTHTSPEAFREIEESPFRGDFSSHSLIRHEEHEGEEGLCIDWSSDHSAFYPISRISSIASPFSTFEKHLPKRGQRRMWNSKTSLLRESEHLHVQYDDLVNMSSREQSLFDMLNQLHSAGIVVIKGVPTDKTEDKDCSLREVMGLIGELRNTFYGETWNVRNVPNSRNVAYTNLNLGMHMDLLYFSSPPRFQALHCLRNRVEGGSSYFVDSFAAAREILGDPDYSPPFIDFEYDNDGHYLHHSHPLMPRDRANLYKLKAAVNWSPPFQGVPNLGLTGRHRGAQMAWYRALDVFQTTIDQTHRKWEFTMKEGDLVLFDNRRVLHARRAFRDWSEKERIERGVEIVEGESSRWLKGCYLDGEVVWDKLATLNSKLNAPNTR